VGAGVGEGVGVGEGEGEGDGDGVGEGEGDGDGVGVGLVVGGVLVGGVLVGGVLVGAGTGTLAPVPDVALAVLAAGATPFEPDPEDPQPARTTTPAIHALLRTTRLRLC
jgi:hypothetical protein